MELVWKRISADALAAAGLCMREGHFRSAASRAYYAVFAAVTAALLGSGQQPPSRGNWSHRQLPDLIRDHLTAALGPGRVRDMRRIVTVNYSMRIIADYLTAQDVDSISARRCVANANTAIRFLEPRK